MNCYLCGRDVPDFIAHYEVCFETGAADITEEERRVRRRRLYRALSQIGLWPPGGLPSFAEKPRQFTEVEKIEGF